MAVISAPESVVGMRADPSAAHRRDRLRGVDHPAAAQRDQGRVLARESMIAAATSGTCPRST